MFPPGKAVQIETNRRFLSVFRLNLQGFGGKRESGTGVAVGPVGGLLAVFAALLALLRARARGLAVVVVGSARGVVGFLGLVGMMDVCSGWGGVGARLWLSLWSAMAVGWAGRG